MTCQLCLKAEKRIIKSLSPVSDKTREVSANTLRELCRIEQEMKARRENWLLAAAAMFWLGLVSVGLVIVWGYENTPGNAAQPPPVWPVESPIPRAPDRPTLIMLAHPHCPCTRASLGELALLLTQCQGLVTASVHFYQPAGSPATWAKTDLWQSAAAIPGVSVHLDEEGATARQFHAATSGQVLLYDAAGQLLFSGGITGSRGHSGANDGRSAIVSLLTTGTAARRRHPVFGCALFEASCPEPQGEVPLCNP